MKEGNLSHEQCVLILDKLSEILDQMKDKDSENKDFIDKQTNKIGAIELGSLALLATVASAGAIVLKKLPKD